jgi:hypothetical protein
VESSVIMAHRLTRSSKCQWQYEFSEIRHLAPT